LKDSIRFDENEIINIKFKIMKTNTILLFIFLASSNLMSGQVGQDSIRINYRYDSSHVNENFSAEEIWGIHKTAYIKQLKSKGLTDEEIKRHLVIYEKNKEDFITQVNKNQRLAAIQRQKATEQRAIARTARQEAEKMRKQADVLRKKADELRKQAEEQREKNLIQRDKARDFRKQAEVERAKADKLRELAKIERAKADKLRELAKIQRAKAEQQRQNLQERRTNSKTLLTKNITLAKDSNTNQPISFKVASKTALRIDIRAQINSGYTLIEIYNPKGVKEGELSLDSKSTSNSNTYRSKNTSAALDKTITGAEVGDWQIKISSKGSKGTVAISVAQDIKQAKGE
jgi:hypothetical protein